MRWPVVSLERVLISAGSGTWGKEPDGSAPAYRILRSTNIRDGRLVLDDAALRAVSDSSAAKYLVSPGDIIVTTSSGSAHLIGKNALVEDLPGPYLFSNFTWRLRPNPAVIFPRFLYYYLNSASAIAELGRIQSTTSGLRNLNTRLYVAQPVPLPGLSEQRRIVEILDQSDRLGHLRAEADAKAERILPALFIKMFGDPATNPMRWKVASFDELFDDITADCPKLQRKDYRPSGRFPVVDQGKELIAGYSDDERLAVRRDLPVVVFGDHTRVVKYIDFPFIAGADGSRVFKVRSAFAPAFAAMHLALQPIPELGYSRHMRVLRHMDFMQPTDTAQLRFHTLATTFRALAAPVASRRAHVHRLVALISVRAFRGDLTALWRASRRQELRDDMGEQAKQLVLKELAEA